MNPWIVSAALVALIAFLIHTFVGGRRVAKPMLATRELEPFPKYTLYFCWHMVTILLLAMVFALGFGAWTGVRSMVIPVCLLATAFCLLNLGMALAFRVKLPQWSLFLVIALLSGIGLLR